MDITACHSAEPAVAEMASFSESLERRTRGWAGAWELEEGESAAAPARADRARPPARPAGWSVAFVQGPDNSSKKLAWQASGQQRGEWRPEARSGWGQPGRGGWKGWGSSS